MIQILDFKFEVGLILNQWWLVSLEMCSYSGTLLELLNKEMTIVIASQCLDVG